MQVAKLCLRGSVVSYTNKNLNIHQSMDRDKIFLKIDKDPAIMPSKAKFKKKLAETIGGEYVDSRVAEVEWWTAAWRAILSATYHIPLELRTFVPVKVNGKKSEARSVLYDNTTICVNDEISIDISESLPIPPEHKIVINTNSGSYIYYTNERGLLSNPDESTTFEITRNDIRIHGPSYVGEKSHRTEFTGDFFNIQNGDWLTILSGPDTGAKIQIEHASAKKIKFNTPRPLIIGSNQDMMERAYKAIMNDQYIIAQGEPQYFYHPSLQPIHMIFRSRRTNPSIIFDDIQMQKLVKNYGWEFIAQIWKENKRDMIKTQTTINDSAEIVATKLVVSLFCSTKDSVKFEMKPGFISVETGIIPFNTAYKISELKREFLAYNVDIQVQDAGIEIKAIGKTPIISRKISEVQFRQIQSFDESYDDKSSKDIIESHILDKSKLVDSFESIASKDAIQSLMNNLPINAAKLVSTMLNPPSGLRNGPKGIPMECDIAQHMGLRTPQIKKLKETIKLHMLALGMGPDEEKLNN